MPLNNAVLDFHPLGVIDTPAGPRQRVVLVAAQRDMVERLLGAIEQAGLIPVGNRPVRLRPDPLAVRARTQSPTPRRRRDPRVLYLNVDGLTNLAIAEGPVCRFTRVVAGGIESMAAELAAKREISTPEARALLFAANLTDAPNGDEWGPRSAEQPAPAEAPAAPAAGRLRARRGRGARRHFATPAPRPQGEPGAGRGPGSGARADPEQPPGGYEADEQVPYEDSYADGSFAAPTTTTTSTGCSRAASATSTARFATRWTSTAPRRAAGTSPTWS